MIFRVAKTPNQDPFAAIKYKQESKSCIIESSFISSLGTKILCKVSLKKCLFFQNFSFNSWSIQCDQSVKSNGKVEK